MKLEIRTKRMMLRLLEQGDIDYLAELHSDPEVFKFFPDGTRDREQTTSRVADFIGYYEKHGLPTFLMFDLETGDFIGRCGFAPVANGEIEVGYVTHQKFWGRGYASEALIAMLEWAREKLNTEYVIAMAPVEHHASQRVMRNGGMLFFKNDIAHGMPCCFYRINFKE